MDFNKCLSGPMKCIMIMMLILYIISPIDFIPEILLGPIGLIDDAGALFALLGLAVSGDGKNSFGKILDIFK